MSATSVGLFEQTASQYGEVWYDIDGKRAMSRGTTPEAVLETIYTLAGIQAPAFEDDDEVFRGHPLAVRPRGAATAYYVIWPATVLTAAFFNQRRYSG